MKVKNIILLRIINKRLLLQTILSEKNVVAHMVKISSALVNEKLIQ